MLKIAIYGKGGIGKSTTTSNLAAAFAEQGLKVMQIGCDPKADSTSMLMHGKKVLSVLDNIKTERPDLCLEDLVHSGYGGVLCVEAGGPTPGIGCAGRGIITAFEKLEELKAYEVYKPDIVLYDVLGDVVCGGFAMPLRKKYADKVCIVTSGEKMSLFAARNIAFAIENFKNRGYARLEGIILNRRNVENEFELTADFARDAQTQILADIPRCEYITKAENQNMTVVEAFPNEDISHVYRKLAKRLLMENTNED